MSRIDARIQHRLVTEAKKYLKDVKHVGNDDLKGENKGIVLTQGHIEEWLQVFADDRIRLDGCNHATVKR